MSGSWNHPPRLRFDLPGGDPMFDKFGRLLCPTCGEPMTHAAKFDSHHEGVVRTAFRARVHLRVLRATSEENVNETSPPHVSASGSGKCRSANRIACCRTR